MKSAYELAMERLEKESGPGKKLNDSQKARIAEIEKKYDAKVAEYKLDFDSKYQALRDVTELESLKSETANKISDIEDSREKEKEEVWNNPT